jgi:hypothetical protein
MSFTTLNDLHRMEVTLAMACVTEEKWVRRMLKFVARLTTPLNSELWLNVAVIVKFDSHSREGIIKELSALCALTAQREATAFNLIEELECQAGIRFYFKRQTELFTCRMCRQSHIRRIGLVRLIRTSKAMRLTAARPTSTA